MLADADADAEDNDAYAGVRRTREALWAAGGGRWHLVGRAQPPTVLAHPPPQIVECTATICALNRNALHCTAVTPMHKTGTPSLHTEYLSFFSTGTNFD